MHEPDATAHADVREDILAIRALWDAMARGWAEGDAARFARSFAEDCDFTTVRGDKPAGRPGIEAGHAILFHGPYAGTALETDVRAIRFLRLDLATVDAESTIGAPGGVVLARTHALAVVERTATRPWLIRAFHNMIPAAPGSGHHPDPRSPR
ncbi:SgcJ/EcaC family oxidoreductase [Streptomyces poriticola]|uniref:SgcJ/EcaC family oxidoreductase n=1 Tax=Streptomyces poriticola TaxID=3120506 RepID=UPI002FCE0457